MNNDNNKERVIKSVLSKIVVAMVAIIALLLSSAYVARNKITSYAVNQLLTGPNKPFAKGNEALDYLSSLQAQLTCLDFSLNSRFDLVIHRACVNSTVANIELKQVLIHWQYHPPQQNSSQLNDQSFLAWKINAIAIKYLDIIAKPELITLISKAKAKAKPEPKDRQTLTWLVFSSYLNEFARFQSPMPINVGAFSYHPPDNLAQKKQRNIARFVGKVLLDDQHIDLSLKNANKLAVLSLKVFKQANSAAEPSLTANVSANLAQLQNLLFFHQVKLPLELGVQAKLTGQLTSQLQWQKQTLRAETTLADFSLHSNIHHLNGELSWHTTFGQNTQQITVLPTTKINLKYSQQALTRLLLTKIDGSSAANIKQLLSDNPFDELAISLQGNINYNKENQTLTISRVDLNTVHAKKLRLALSDITLAFPLANLTDTALQAATFAVQTPLKVSALSKMTSQPLQVQLHGKIQQHIDVINNKQASWKITILPSRVSAAAINVSVAENKTVTINQLTNHFFGELGVTSQGKITPKLQANISASGVALPQVIQLKQLDIQANIGGFYGTKNNALSINGAVNTDTIKLAQFALSGEINEPVIAVRADKLKVIDLQALNIKLPVTLELIDGTLAYNFTGKLLKNIEQSKFNLAIGLQDVSGNINNTWLQGLNLQHSLQLSAGTLKSLPVAEQILSVDSIETPVPISHLSLSPLIEFQNNQFSVTANDIVGNIFEGKFKIPQAQWPLIKDRSVDIQLDQINLARVLALDKKQGIKVTGKISGNLPLSYNGQHFLIAKGELFNVSNGVIQVLNNTSIEALKANNEELKLAFEALQNLQYHQLSSKVNMAQDGYMLLETAIKGHNPDLDNEVNLNLNINYDLVGLLKSLSISQQLESEMLNRLPNKE